MRSFSLDVTLCDGYEHYIRFPTKTLFLIDLSLIQFRSILLFLILFKMKKDSSFFMFS